MGLTHRSVGICDARRSAPSPAPDASWQRVDRAGHLLLPGFIDTHVHMPQLEVIASYGTELLEWLNTYTFPAERRYADPAVCTAGAARFLDALLAHGSTAAVVFPTVHKGSAEALFAGAQTRGMRLIRIRDTETGQVFEEKAFREEIARLKAAAAASS